MPAVLENKLTKEEARALSSPPQRGAIRLRLFELSQRMSARGHRLMDALHAAVWLGLMDREQLNAVVAQHYEEAALYRSAEQNLYGFFPWESQLILNHFKECRFVVVAAAGGGREMIALARAGVRVDGFECNPTLLGTCKEFLAQAGVSARILLAPADSVPSGLQEYDGAIVGYGAYGHIIGRAKRVSFLRDLKFHLHPRAPLFLSTGRRPVGSGYHLWIYRIARAIRMIRGGRPIEVGDDLPDCFTHRFVVSELRSELEDAGFKFVTHVETHEIYAVAEA